MSNMRFIDDWKDEKKIEAYRYIQKTLGEKLREKEPEIIQPVSLGDSWRVAKERKKITGLQTGYELIDTPESLAGLNKGSLYVIGGMTGVGKTLFACNLVLNVLIRENVRTLFLTTEMPHWTVSQRLFRMWQNYLSDEESFAALKLDYLDHQADISTKLIDATLEQSKTSPAGKYDLLVVDNLQWFSRGGADIAESTGLATQAIKNMAIKHDLPVVLVSHLNRETYKQNNPEMNNLKGSSYIEQDADAVILLSRNTDEESDDEYRTDVLRVNVRKNRLTGNLVRFCLISDSHDVLSPIDAKDAKRPKSILGWKK